MHTHIFKEAFIGTLIYMVPALADQSFGVKSTTNWGTWEGWGTSLAWWGQVYGNRDDVANIFFSYASTSLNGQSIPGLGLNIVRYNAGACSSNSYQGSKMVVSSTIRPWRQMDGFWVDGTSSNPSSSSWNWNVDANQRMAMEKARKNGANIFELFSNSPMWWMCKNRNPSGASDGSENINSAYLQQHALYMATVAKHASVNWNITFDAVDPFNEPSGTWWTANGKQEGCNMKVSTQSTIINYLRTEMDKQGLSGMKISASDETNIDTAANTLRSLSAAAVSNIDRVNVHGYQGTGGNRAALYSAVVAKGKKLWNSEHGESDGTGISLVASLMLDLRRLHPTAWSYWQVLDHDGWGLIDADNDRATLKSANQKYFAFAQFTRHIRPGMTILDAGGDAAVAAYDAKTGKLVIVAVNLSSTSQYFTFDLSAFGVTSGAVVPRWYTYLGSSSSRYVSAPSDTTVSGSSFRVLFNANVIQTFEIIVRAGSGGNPTTTTGAVSTTRSVATTTTRQVTTTASGGGGGTVAQYGQCGGLTWTGATKCVSPYTCKVSNEYYSQCL